MNTSAAIPGDLELDAQLRRGGPMNMARAIEVMEQFDLQGLVLGDPLNVFHAIGYWPQIALTKAGQPPGSFVLLSRDPARAPGFVTTHFIHYYTWADAGFEQPLEIWLYSEAGDDGLDLAMAAPEQCADRGLAPLTPVERRRRAAQQAVSGARATSHDAGAALVKAMRGLGLWQGRIACDHPVIAAVCAHHDRPGVVIDADNILRHIRMVKSPLELLLMRRASQANMRAVQSVAASVRAGASYRDLRQVYAEQTAQLGNRVTFLTVDRVSSELSDERIRDGQTLFIDGVSHFRHYHGDFARTVFVGEPTVAAERAARAAIAGWNAVREVLRPGIRYSDIVNAGLKAVQGNGYAGRVGFGPHSVGLMHTDEPGEDAQGFYRKADLVLQPNMVLSVDCPVMDTGIGGSAHLEDLMLITANGAEPIHDILEPVIRL